MNKIIIAEDIKRFFEKQKSFLDRSNIGIFAITSNDGALDIHRTEKANLIITKLDMPGMSTETLCSAIRKDEALRRVSIIIVCPNDKAEIERSMKCRANAIITMPLNPEDFLEKTHRLLNISKREAYRVLSSIKVEGKSQNKPFFCFLENISASGILLETDNILDIGDTLRCSFFLPNSINIIADGEIVRAIINKNEFEANQYGIRFINLPPEYSAAIEAFIEKESQKER
jgi:CheY-like chemotaxis protein